MKTSALILFLAVCSISLSAQNTIWFDKNWKETSEENSVYYRLPPKKTTKGYLIVDYYKSGQIQMKGYSKVATLNKEEFEGVVLYYHENGKLFHEASYKNGKLNGTRKVFYESGELEQQGRYKEGKREGMWKTFLKNGKIKTKGRYRNGEKVGVWKTFYRNLY